MKRLVLVGGGHAHLGVLRALAQAPAHGLDVVLVSPLPFQGYSGMLPGWMAGHYSATQCRIDLRANAQRGGARFHHARVSAIDAGARLLTLDDGSQLGYDLLSLDSGSEVDRSPFAPCGERLLALKPLDDFMARWPAVAAAARIMPGYRICVVGGGAAGVEIALAAAHAVGGAGKGTVQLVAGAAGLLSGHTSWVRQRAASELAARSIAVHMGRAQGDPLGLALDDGTRLRADCVILATGARAPSYVLGSGLALDRHGYVAVNARHQSPSHPEVFAAGDVCVRHDVAMARSGTHAVHAGPVLAANLLAAARGGALRSYRPRRHSLYLLACGPRHAIASWGRLGAHGAWAWRLKDWIDRRFVDRFAAASPVLEYQ